MHSIKLKTQTYILLEDVKLLLLKQQDAQLSHNTIIQYALKALLQKIISTTDAVS
jgi:hypothetical protein